MNLYLKIFLIILPIYLLIDFIWLGVVMKGFYNNQFRSLNEEGVLMKNWFVALFVYFLIPAGIIFFVMPKISGFGFDNFLLGGLYGLIVYGVYDLTNYATLADWGLKITIVDTLWGIFICGFLSYLLPYILRLLGY
ncbi:MAG TPA: DUF2177 family protein [Candidatus Paceibacterota bacterium]|nr:DUF2177 family protein [Candidatus Paceibacterota bacterium]